MFKYPFSFNGYIGRVEYIISFSFCFSLLYAISYIIFNHRSAYGLTVYYLPLFWLAFAQGTKRCHDLGRNGIWQLVPFYFFVLFFKSGQKAFDDKKPLIDIRKADHKEESYCNHKLLISVNTSIHSLGAYFLYLIITVILNTLLDVKFSALNTSQELAVNVGILYCFPLFALFSFITVRKFRCNLIFGVLYLVLFLFFAVF